MTMNGFSTGDDESFETGDDFQFVCCLIDSGHRCQQIACSVTYNKRIERMISAKKLSIQVDSNSKHYYICDHHRAVIQNGRTKRRRRDSDDDSNEMDIDLPEVDFYQLQVNTLRRYKRHFKVTTKPGLNKAQLVDILVKHFKTIPVKERDILTYFIYNVKNMNGRDSKNGLDT